MKLLGDRIYLAARYIRRAEIAGYADQLRVLGYEITARWLSGDHDEQQVTDAQFARFAREDVEDVIAADVVVSFTELLAVEGAGRGGRHVEYGIGLALDKHLVIIGPRENIFHRLVAPNIHQFDSWPVFLAQLPPVRRTVTP